MGYSVRALIILFVILQIITIKIDTMLMAAKLLFVYKESKTLT